MPCFTQKKYRKEGKMEDNKEKTDLKKFGQF